MSDTYTDLADAAEDLIAEFGRDITIRRASAGTYNPANDTLSGASSTDIAAKAVFTNYSLYQIENTEGLERGDKSVLLTVAPQKGDILVDGTDTLTIISVEEVKPGDTPIIWKAQARE